MSLIVNVFVDDLEDKINRRIVVNENISLTNFCESIIVSLNGKKIPFYVLRHKKKFYYPFSILEDDDVFSMFDLTLKDFKLKKGNEFDLLYDYSNGTYPIVIKIENKIKEDNTNDFEVLSGTGYGLRDDMKSFELRLLFMEKRKEFLKYYAKDAEEYLEKKFDYVEVNNRIREYFEYKKELLKPKRYVFNVCLEGFTKEIKRKIIVNSDITLADFCKKIVVSMNGDLSHSYGIKKNKEYLDDEVFEFVELYYLYLKEKQRLKVIYDFGDNWTFNLTVSKIIDDFGECDFEVLSGKGYGIIDDCGGIWGLEDIFSGENDEWGKYDINYFDLDECNDEVRKV